MCSFPDFSYCIWCLIVITKIFFHRQSPYDQEVTDTNTTTAATTTTAASNTPTAANTTAGGMENVEVSLLFSRQGICYNITTGIHLEIMYAETGRSKGYPLLEVVGAMIR